MPKDSITAVILAGGRATRMQGQDKGLLLLNQRPMIQSIIERLAPQVEQLLINANRHPADYREFHFPVINDGNMDFNGPLAGVLSAMQYGSSEYLLLSPCDAPLIPLNLARKLMDALQKNTVDVAIPFDGNHLQPTFSLIKTTLMPSLQHFLHTSERQCRKWLTQQSHVTVDFSTQADEFININTLDEMRRFENGPYGV